MATAPILDGELQGLDERLAESEARFTDLRPGCEKCIHWHGAPETPTLVSVVYLHGFSASRDETAPVTGNVAAELGANVFYTRLAGHGRSAAAMAEPTVEDWLADTREAIHIGKLLGERVFVIGVSTGGTLAVWAAHELAADVAALGLISPNFGTAAFGSFLLRWPGRRWITRTILGSELGGGDDDNPEARRVWTAGYPPDALFPMADLVASVTKLDHARCQQPAITLYCEQDGTVNHKRVVSNMRKWGGSPNHREAVTVPDGSSTHVIAGDITGPSMVAPVSEKLTAFFRQC